MVHQILTSFHFHSFTTFILPAQRQGHPLSTNLVSHIQTSGHKPVLFLAWPPQPPVLHWIEQLPQGVSHRRLGQMRVPPGNASSGATNTAMPWLVFHFLP